ncbi:MAG: endolytic transglycosylase MltG [Nocardioidaceae bacterium]
MGHRRKKRPKRGKGCLAVLVAFAILAGGAYAAYSYGFTALKEKLAPPPDYSGAGHGSVIVEVKQGDVAPDIAATLLKKHVVESSQAFIDAAKSDPASVGIQVGFYPLKHQMSAKSALAVLENPKNLMQNAVTIPEGYTAKQIVSTLAAKTHFSAAKYEQVLKRPSAIGLPSYAHGNVEGYLFPATYEVPPNATPTSILSMMVQRYDEAAQSLDLSKRAATLGYSTHDVMTVASLVQSEARFGKDFPKVARVIYNRLKKHMPLQFDSTVHYAVGKDGSVGTSASDRSSSSPYNTYRFAGLPPTPISSPGEQAIRAALHPTSGAWIYFVTTNPDTGVTKFATSYHQHLKNVAEFKRWCAKSSHC